LLCEHNILNKKCDKCRTDKYCEHSRLKDKCIDCNPNILCSHGKQKYYCKKCGGNGLCKSEWCETYKPKNPDYEGYCMRCFVHLFPDRQNSRNYKTKERTVVDEVMSYFPEFTWVADKKIQDGCSSRRPDLLLDMGSHIIIVEVDENKHTAYDCSCENKRLMQISKDLNHRSIVFIRFNPDGYTDASGNKIQSCWKANNYGIMSIMNTKQKEWNTRIDALINQIEYWVENPSEKTVEIIELFY